MRIYPKKPIARGCLPLQTMVSIKYHKIKVTPDNMAPKLSNFVSISIEIMEFKVQYATVRKQTVYCGLCSLSFFEVRNVMILPNFAL